MMKWERGGIKDQDIIKLYLRKKVINILGMCV